MLLKTSHGPPHTVDDIERAVRAMSSGQYKRLLKYGKRLLRTISGEEPEDLIQEAMKRILEGGRFWPNGVEFYSFICGVMRSVANQWREREKHTVSDLNSFTLLRDTNPDPERVLSARAIVAYIRSAFSKTSKEHRILTELENDSDRSEIITALQISPTELDSGKRQIRRVAKRLDLSGGLTK